MFWRLWKHRTYLPNSNSGGDGTIEEFEEGFNEFFRIDDDKLRRMIAATNPDDS
jgi:hypothetical protein